MAIVLFLTVPFRNICTISCNGTTVPMRLGLQLERVKDQPDAVVQLGVAHATVQCMELLSRGVPGIHFYTLNKSPATRMIVSALRARS